MKLYFVRHGQTQFNKDGKNTGQIDEPLIEGGIEQAKKTRDELSSDFELIYSSDLVRCKKTAEIINEKLNVPIIYDARLRERDFGSLVGKSWAEFDPGLKEKDMHQQYDYRPYGGESAEDVKRRIFSFVKDIKKDHSNKKVLVVTSGGIVRLLHNLLNKEIHEKIHNASLHEFEFPDD